MKKKLILIFMVALGIKNAMICCMEDLQKNKKTHEYYENGKEILKHINEAIINNDCDEQKEYKDRLNDFMEGYFFSLSMEDRSRFEIEFNKTSTNTLNALAQQMSSKQKSSVSSENQPLKENLLMYFLHSISLGKGTGSKSGHNSPNNSKPPSPVMVTKKLSHSRSRESYKLLEDESPPNLNFSKKLSQVKSSPNIKKHYEELKKTSSSELPVFSKNLKKDQKFECDNYQEDLRPLFEKMQLLGHLYLGKKSPNLISQDDTKEIEYYSKKSKN